ncbi:MAG: 1-deoxy-D-xylulose-5-phosphate reductoisomerase [Eubacteriales bacterium]|nr:1-deoxy-D-xylulose-5-phosphate reductoisomerase [Christensenellaceae bacterium]MDY3241521.1 1-deoxy-D-xylulose-5-phosphate reductoisomerase [Eubacteriales bacterium]MCI7584107.1 1-deoxy-D-xylulose-5-phosphate reductoisomerase [Christensenellaceae bacterium]MCI7769395.1 1-deoxy-D-xylulose-5-phosphate reductoisomerase [Christensenellaceae bacterium]MDD7091915.1 1-deoxy-D-xylulose-5-phosphate reductoisomerase [Christensenellaceae bacterium]
MKTKQIMILGSTGSVGTKALQIVEKNPEQFRVVGLSTNTNVKVLAEQIMKFKPRYVAVTDAAARAEFVKYKPPFVQVLPMEELSQIKVDCVINGMVGISGLKPSMNVLKNGSTLGIANKEPIVAAGRLMREAAERYGATIIPVDSEHSAIFQCLKAGQTKDVKKVTLTASGGPFVDYTEQQLATVTPQMAIKHPVWSMGTKVSIDSATLMNKGLEVIEAMNLFNLPKEKVDVIVHRESVIHSFVEFIDKTVMACMSMPNMRLPVQLAMTYPDRIDSFVESLDLVKLGALHFERPDLKKFRCLSLAIEAAKLGETACVAVSAADEIAVAEFISGRIGFNDIARYVEKGMSYARGNKVGSVDEVLSIDETVKKYIRQVMR